MSWPWKGFGLAVGTAAVVAVLRRVWSPVVARFGGVSAIVAERAAEAHHEAAQRAKELAERAEALQQSEQYYRTVADNTYAWEFWVDPEGRFLYCSPSCQRLTGYEAREFLADPELFHRIIYPEDEGRYEEHRGSRREACATEEAEFRIVRRDGAVRWIGHACQAVYDDRGRFLGIRGSNRDITEQKNAEEALRENETRLRLAFEVSGAGVWEFAPSTGQVTGDAIARRLYGLEEAPEVLDFTETVAPLFHPDDRPRIAKHLAAALDPAGDGHYRIEYRIVRPDGAVRWLEVHGQTFFSGVGTSRRAVRMIGVSADVTERRESVEAMAAAKRNADEAKAEAERANAAKSQFLANMSHELRTPMNSILGMTELALEEDLSATVRDFVETARDSAGSLLALIDEILDLSRIEAGMLLLESSPFDLRAVVENTIKAIAVRARQKRLELACHVSPDVPERILGDPLRLRQILTNLLSNAIKFTERGEVAVRVEVEEGDEPGITGESLPPATVALRFAVSDTGIGIAPEDHARIFAPFTQADATMARRYGGTGLGLSIVVRLVEMLGGRLWLESEPGRGSTFFFRVPLRCAADVEPADDQHPLGLTGREQEAVVRQPPIARRPLRVLLAEDTPANQKVALHVLSKRGHVVVVAENGREALERLGREDFDAVLMDVQMPVMDGFQATAEIRALRDARKARIPIIAMTAHALKGDEERCLKAGMNAYLSKPINGPEMIAVVERLGEEGTVKSEDSSGERAAARSAAPFDLDEAIRRCYGKYSLFQDMVESLFDEADSLVQQMREALARGEGEEVGRAAHRLRNSLVYLGAGPAAEGALQAEQIGRSGDAARLAQSVAALERHVAILKEALVPHRRHDPAKSGI